jgi:hypothetical protein
MHTRNASRVLAVAVMAALGTFVVSALVSQAALSAPDAQHPDFNGVWTNDGMSFINPQRGPDGSVICIVGCRPAQAEKTAGEAAKAAPDRSPSAGSAGAQERPPAAPRARPKPPRPNYKPEFQAKVADLDKRQVETDPALRCRNPGLPRIGPPSAIIQQEKLITFLYEDLNGSFFRMIPLGGKHNPKAEATFLGDSVANWEGDTLVIQAQNFVDETWLIDDGSFHTTGLKVTERLRMDGDKILYQAIADDPAVLAEPWHMPERKLKRSTEPLSEPLPCIEQDLDHIVDGTHHDNQR